MPNEPTVVVVKFVPEIELPHDPIHIPATIDLEGGPGGGGGIPGLPAGVLGGVGAIFGGAAAGRMRGAVGAVQAAVAALASGGPYVIAIVGALGVAFAGVVVQVYAAVQAVKLLWSAGKVGLQGLIALVKIVASGFINLASFAIQISVDTLRKFTQGVEQLGIAVGRHIMGFLKRAIGMFADFEQSVANTVTVMGKFGAEGLALRDKVMDAMEELTVSSRFMAKDAAEAAYHIASAGFSQLNDVIPMTRGAIMLAEATLTDLGYSAETVVGVMNQFNLRGEDAIRMANVFAAAIGKSPALMNKLATAMQYVGSTAHMYGLSLEETVGWLMTMFKSGVKGSMAGMELQNVFNSLAKRTAKGTAVLKEYGINLENVSIAQQGLAPVLRQFEALGVRLQKAYGPKVGMGMLAEILQRSFTLRAARGLTRILVQGVGTAEKFTKAITGTNTAFLMQQDQLRTISGAWRKVISIWENAYYDVLRAGLGPGLYLLLGSLRSLIATLREMGVFKVFGAAVGVAVDTFHQFLLAITPYLLGAVSRLTALLPTLGQAFAIAFVAILPTAIRLLQVLPQLLIQFFAAAIPLVLQFAEDVLPKLLDFAVQVLPRLIDLFATLGMTLLELVTDNGDLVIAWFGALVDVARAVAGVLPELLPTITALAPTFARLIVQLLRLTVQVLPTLLPALLELAKMFTQLAVAGVQMLCAMLIQFMYVLVALLPIAQQLTGWLVFLGALFVKHLPAGILVAGKLLSIMGDILVAIIGNFGGLDQAIGTTLVWLDQNLVPVLITALNTFADFLDIAKGGVYIMSLIPGALYLWYLSILPVIAAIGILSAQVAGLIQGIAWLLELFNMIPGVNLDDTVKAAQGIRDAFWETTKALGQIEPTLRKAAIMAPGVAVKIGGIMGATAAGAGGIAGGVGAGGYGPVLPPGYGGGPQLAPASYGAGRGYGAVVGPFYVNDADQVGRVAQGVVNTTARMNYTAARVGAGGPRLVLSPSGKGLIWEDPNTWRVGWRQPTH